MQLLSTVRSIGHYLPAFRSRINQPQHAIGVSKPLALLCLVLSLLFLGIRNAQAQESPFRLQFVSQDGSTLESISRGDLGAGTVAIFHAQHSPEQPRLIIRFQNDETGANADLFDNAQETLVWQDGPVNLTSSSVPAVRMYAPDGWWLRDDVTNYNLDISIYGRVNAMWGAALTEVVERGGWLREIGEGSNRLAVRIQTADPQFTGVPQWDLRQLQPRFAPSGYYRTNYAERRCDSPARTQPSVVNAWPFIATDAIGARFEQPVGQVVPPIVVDWERGVVTYFSELVTVRNQSCSYAIYSIQALQNRDVNPQNFETPFAFYDFAEANNGYPNVIMRTEYFSPRDVWSYGLKVEGQEIRAVPDAFQRIRYSWRTAAGDGTWDYKIEVMGTNEYEEQLEIAGGLFTVLAPSHERFPGWVAERAWPVTSFVSIENKPYFSQEGIYEFAPTQAGVGYLYGWADVPETAFSFIPEGQRGEYRYQTAQDVSFYTSPIDGRLHLRSAEGGIWQIDERSTLELVKIDDTPYLKGWVTKRDDEPREALYQLPGFLLYASDGAVVLNAADVPAATQDNVTLPTDTASWETVRALEETLAASERYPLDLNAWLSHFSTDRTTRFENAQVSNVRATENGFRFRLVMNNDFEIVRNDLALPIKVQDSAEFIIEYDGIAFRSLAADGPDLAMTLAFSDERVAFRPILTRLQLSNLGVEDVIDAQWQIIAEHPEQRIVIVDETLTLFSAETQQQLTSWSPKHPGEWTVRAELRRADELLFSQEQTTTVTRTTSEVPFLQYTSPLGWPILIITLALSSVAVVIGQALHDQSL